MSRYGTAILAGAVWAALALSAPALADGGPCDAPQGPPQYPDKFDWNGSYMLGDIGGLRTKAQAAGVTLCSQYNAYALSLIHI